MYVLFSFRLNFVGKFVKPRRHYTRIEFGKLLYFVSAHRHIDCKVESDVFTEGNPFRMNYTMRSSKHKTKKKDTESGFLSLCDISTRCTLLSLCLTLPLKEMHSFNYLRGRVSVKLILKPMSNHLSWIDRQTF